MTAAECKPGVWVVTPVGEDGILLHPDPRRPSRWFVYRDGKGEYHDTSELRKAECDD